MKKVIIPLEQQYYFNAAIDGPLSFSLQILREESAYDADLAPETRALKYIENLAKRSAENVYLIFAENDMAPSSGLRMKKGALWGDCQLRELDNRSFEVLIYENYTRLVSIVDLKDFSYDSPSKILNWMSSLLLFSNLNLDEISLLVREWFSKDRKSVQPYNYDAIAKTLCNLSSTAVIRYFPADNGRPESLVAVGQKSYLQDSMAFPIQDLI